ncbi:MAG: TonB-dependent receptor [Desulfococcaceae bacterium]|nr:TonB-dependent receptor [Desulfococcaceae bacterium]
MKRGNGRGCFFRLKGGVSLLCFLIFPMLSFAAEQELKTEELVQMSLDDLMNTVVVTASRAEIPLSRVSKSISVVSRKDMEDARQYFLPEMIDNVPGVYLKRNGGPGRISRINMRGAKYQYTQFQYNGIPLKDATDILNSFNSYVQDLYGGEDIERIEVLKGSNSTLYGSQAMGGVINIIPAKWNQELVLESRNEVGSNNTVFASARAAYGKENFYLDINPLYYDTDGESFSGSHDYYYEKKGLSAGAGYKFSEGMSLEFNSLYSDTEAPLHAQFPGLDAQQRLTGNRAAEDQHTENSLFLAGLTFTHQVNSVWDYSLKAAYSETRRHYFNSSVSADKSEYNGDTSYLEMQHNLRFTDWMNLTVGMDYEKSDYENREPLNAFQEIYDPRIFSYNWDYWDAFCMLRFSFLDDSLLLDAGGRYNDHEKFDSETVWEISAAYIFKDFGTKIHGHTGTGYRTPALYEVYGGYLFNGELIPTGNPDLEPEKSISYEIGVDQFLFDNSLNFGLTWFHIDFDDLVIYSLRYENGSEGRSEGIETYVHYQPCPYVRFGLAYTYADPEYKDSTSGKWLREPSFPKNKFSFTTSLYPMEKLRIWFRVIWQDEKIVPLYDSAFNQTLWEEDSVTTVDAAVSYNISENFDVWLRAENLFDEDYSEGGYAMPGRWIFGGVKLMF